MNQRSEVALNNHELTLIENNEVFSIINHYIEKKEHDFTLKA